MRNIRKQRHRNQGFTLIELMVVVSIVAFIGSITLVNLAQARQKAARTVLVANFKQLFTAIEQYAQDHDGVYPDRFYTTDYEGPTDPA
jgi:prepilin-type N-terminal cleavage/methylation domain-containing protein